MSQGQRNEGQGTPAPEQQNLLLDGAEEDMLEHAPELKDDAAYVEMNVAQADGPEIDVSGATPKTLDSEDMAGAVNAVPAEFEDDHDRDMGTAAGDDHDDDYSDMVVADAVTDDREGLPIDPDTLSEFCDNLQRLAYGPEDNIDPLAVQKALDILAIDIQHPVHEDLGAMGREPQPHARICQAFLRNGIPINVHVRMPGEGPPDERVIAKVNRRNYDVVGTENGKHVALSMRDSGRVIMLHGDFDGLLKEQQVNPDARDTHIPCPSGVPYVESTADTAKVLPGAAPEETAARRGPAAPASPGAVPLGSNGGGGSPGSLGGGRPGKPVAAPRGRQVAADTGGDATFGGGGRKDVAATRGKGRRSRDGGGGGGGGGSGAVSAIERAFDAMRVDRRERSARNALNSLMSTTDKVEDYAERMRNEGTALPSAQLLTTGLLARMGANINTLQKHGGKLNQEDAPAATVAMLRAMHAIDAVDEAAQTVEEQEGTSEQQEEIRALCERIRAAIRAMLQAFGTGRAPAQGEGPGSGPSPGTGPGGP